MNAEIVPNRVRFAFPFAILTKPDTVRLVAGEEFRYTLRSPSLEQWLPQLLSSFAREVEWRPLLNQLPCERHQQALEIISRLYGERVLLEGNGDHSHMPSPLRWVVEGSGKLSERLRGAVPAVLTNALPGYSRLCGRPRFQLALPPVRRGRVALDFVRTYGPRIRQLRIPATRRAMSRMFDPKFSTAFACPRDL